MAARVITALAHGTFFGVGSLVATGLVAPERKASAIAVMFTGLTIATLLGVPFGAWLGLAFGWRATFWAVTGVGLLAFAVLAALVPRAEESSEKSAAARGVRRSGPHAGAARPADDGAGLRRGVRGLHLHPADPDRAGRLRKEAVSPILLVFGAGLVGGNLVGGRWADKLLATALLGPWPC
jgi:DHA1 family inner membrane transport protein